MTLYCVKIYSTTYKYMNYIYYIYINIMHTHAYLLLNKYKNLFSLVKITCIKDMLHPENL